MMYHMTIGKYKSVGCENKPGTASTAITLLSAVLNFNTYYRRGHDFNSLCNCQRICIQQTGIVSYSDLLLILRRDVIRKKKRIAVMFGMFHE